MPFDKLRAHLSRAELGSASLLSSVGLSGRLAEAKTFESELPQDPSCTQTRATPFCQSVAQPHRTPREKAADSVRVVSAVELVKQAGQRNEAEAEADDREPPPVDGSQHDEHEGER
jgi:hypothetical protein